MTQILDVNVVFAAHVSGHPSHPVVRPWLDGVLSSGQRFTVTSGVAASVVRLVTNDRFVQPAESPAQAFAYLQALRGQPGHVPLEPGSRHLEIFERLSTEYDATGDLVPDAYLAALAIEHGATLVSLDRDFARFEGLRWERPG